MKKSRDHGCAVAQFFTKGSPEISQAVPERGNPLWNSEERKVLQLKIVINFSDSFLIKLFLILMHKDNF